jgi:3-oxoacyl-[acyl-carrier protein] reductase
MTGRADWDFTGRVVAITGASIGIGAETARAFGRAGGRVFLLDVDDEPGRRVAEGVGTYIHCDVTDTDQVTGAFDRINAEAGGLDVLVNNAGGFGRQFGVEDTTDEEWDRIVNLNLKGVFLCSRAAIPMLRESAGGRIINIGSLAGQATFYRSSPPYAAAKAGVHALTRVLAWELARDGITANAVSPSAVLTDRIVAVRGPEERAATEQSIPLRRYGQPADIVEVIMFLASDGSRYMTGETVAVNGGRFMA